MDKSYFDRLRAKNSSIPDAVNTICQMSLQMTKEMNQTWSMPSVLALCATELLTNSIVPLIPPGLPDVFAEVNSSSSILVLSDSRAMGA